MKSRFGVHAFMETTLRCVIFAIFLACLCDCKPAQLFVWRYYRGPGGETFEFNPDLTFSYSEKTEGGFIYKYGAGTWRQEGKKLFIFNTVADVRSLPMKVETTSFSGQSSYLIINILPKRIQTIPNLPQPLEKLNIELLIDGIPHPLQAEKNLFEIGRDSEYAFIRAYTKENVEKGFEVINDTLTSQSVDLKGPCAIFTFEVNCNPSNFAKIKMRDDTIHIIDDRTIKWKGIKLAR